MVYFNEYIIDKFKQIILNEMAISYYSLGCWLLFYIL